VLQSRKCVTAPTALGQSCKREQKETRTSIILNAFFRIVITIKKWQHAPKQPQANANCAIKQESEYLFNCPVQTAKASNLPHVLHASASATCATIQSYNQMTTCVQYARNTAATNVQWQYTLQHFAGSVIVSVSNARETVSKIA